ncbi:MAG TPA: hypothetical protein VM901_13145 [Bdellovibrionota bacterium]|jgi:hypothetical protein|nr:hypothetical protein [Bdellovibrionota bacterium]
MFNIKLSLKFRITLVSLSSVLMLNLAHGKTTLEAVRKRLDMKEPFSAENFAESRDMVLAYVSENPNPKEQDYNRTLHYGIGELLQREPKLKVLSDYTVAILKASRYDSEVPLARENLFKTFRLNPEDELLRGAAVARMETFFEYLGRDPHSDVQVAKSLYALPESEQKYRWMARLLQDYDTSSNAPAVASTLHLLPESKAKYDFIQWSIFRYWDYPGQEVVKHLDALPDSPKKFFFMNFGSPEQKAAAMEYFLKNPKNKEWWRLYGQALAIERTTFTPPVSVLAPYLKHLPENAAKFEILKNALSQDAEMALEAFRLLPKHKNAKQRRELFAIALQRTEGWSSPVAHEAYDVVLKEVRDPTLQKAIRDGRAKLGRCPTLVEQAAGAVVAPAS